MSTESVQRASGRPAAEVHSIGELMAIYPEFRWKQGPTKDGGKWAYAIIGGNKETGEISVIFAIERGTAPEHEHIAGGPYLEFIVLAGGEMQDVNDTGEPVLLCAGDTIMHKKGAGVIHAPKTDSFCWGYYHQPRGMRLTGK